MGFFHYTTDFNNRFGHRPGLIFELPLGFYGVHLFFMISGFVILMTLEQTQNGLDFVVSRFARLYPGYWLSVIFNMALAIFYQFPMTLKDTSVKEVILNFTMLQGAFGTGILDSVYWTLQVELFFYAVMFCFYQLRWLQKIESVAIGWLVVKMISFKWIRFQPLHVFLILDHVHLFIAGMIFYKIYREGFSLKRLSIIGICFLMQAWYVKDWRAMLLSAGFMAAFFLLVRGKLAFIKNPFLVYMGTISYCFYLLHHNLGYAAIRKFSEWGFNPNVNVLVTTSLFLVLASAAAFFVEKPAQAAIKNFYEAR